MWGGAARMGQSASACLRIVRGGGITANAGMMKAWGIGLMDGSGL